MAAGNRCQSFYWLRIYHLTTWAICVPPEVAQVLSLGTSAAQAVSWLAEKEDLRHRLGEIRYGAIDGAWVKVTNKTV